MNAFLLPFFIPFFVSFPSNKFLHISDYTILSTATLLIVAQSAILSLIQEKQYAYKTETFSALEMVLYQF